MVVFVELLATYGNLKSEFPLVIKKSSCKFAIISFIIFIFEFKSSSSQKSGKQIPYFRF